MTAARQLPPQPPDHLRVTNLATVRSRRSPAGRIATTATRIARYVAGPLAAAATSIARRAFDALLLAAAITLAAWAGWQVRPELGAAVAAVLLLAVHWSRRPDGLVVTEAALRAMFAAVRAGWTDEEALTGELSPEREPER